ncbi:MAG: hypothetical protein ACJAVV_001123 [Alphaproteobacteria bacterium]
MGKKTDTAKTVNSIILNLKNPEKECKGTTILSPLQTQSNIQNMKKRFC